MNALLKSKECRDLLAITICCLVFGSWVIALTYKFFHFGYYDWDLAFFAQGMWGLLHGTGFVSLFGTQLLSNHANLIAYAVLPIYKMFPHPLTLVFLKAASVVTAGYVLYLLAKEKLGTEAGIFILCIYFIYMPNIFGVLYEFDFEGLAPAFLMLIYYYYDKGRWLGFLICAAILMLIKENMPLIVLAFSIHGLFVKKDKVRWALIPGVLALAAFFLLVFVFIPHMSGRALGKVSQYYIVNNYKDFGGSIGGVLTSFILHPLKVWQHIVTPVNLKYLNAIFTPLLFLPLVSLDIVFLIAPILIQHLLSASKTEHYIGYGYMLTVAPFLMIAIVESLKVFKDNGKKIWWWILLTILAVNAFVCVINTRSLSNRFVPLKISNETRQTVDDGWGLIKAVPNNASIVASIPFLASLSQRKELYSFYKVFSFNYQTKRHPYQLPRTVEYALIDNRDPWLLEEPDFPANQVRAEKFLNSGDWVVVKNAGRFVLYQRKAL